MLAMIERELRLGPELDAAETRRLEALTGSEGTLRALNEALARSIRSGAVALDDPRLLDHLRRTAADALRINNPRWLAPKTAGEA